jgi:hypothetical protein
MLDFGSTHINMVQVFLYLIWVLFGSAKSILRRDQFGRPRPVYPNSGYITRLLLSRPLRKSWVNRYYLHGLFKLVSIPVSRLRHAEERMDHFAGSCAYHVLIEWKQWTQWTDLSF